MKLWTRLVYYYWGRCGVCIEYRVMTIQFQIKIQFQCYFSEKVNFIKIKNPGLFSVFHKNWKNGTVMETHRCTLDPIHPVLIIIRPWKPLIVCEKLRLSKQYKRCSATQVVWTNFHKASSFRRKITYYFKSQNEKYIPYRTTFTLCGCGN